MIAVARAFSALLQDSGLGFGAPDVTRWPHAWKT
jgi:hypothetical protein